MASPCFIGDELSAAGWRLAGFRVVVPEVREVEQAVNQAMTAAPLLIMTGEVARHLPKVVLDRALASLSPLVLVVPDVGQTAAGIDVAARIRGQLGLLS